MSANNPHSSEASKPHSEVVREERAFNPRHESEFIDVSSTVAKVVEAIVEDSRSKSKEYLERSRSWQAGE